MKHAVYILLLLLIQGCVEVNAEYADTVVVNANVITPTKSISDSVVISDGKIAYVGSGNHIKHYIGEETIVVDAAGATLLPGFQDAHVHPISSQLARNQCALNGLHTVAEYKMKIRKCVKASKDDEWIHGSGWSHRVFGNEQLPGSEFLDDISVQHPMTFTSYDGHTLMANSRAMRIAGISAETDDVSFGRIERDDLGEPTGVFVEDTAQSLVLDYKPKISEDALYDALIDVQRYLHSIGITAIQDALVTLEPGTKFSGLPAYYKADKEGKLSLRVVTALYWDPERGIEQIEDLELAREKYASTRVSTSTVKIWYDGVMHTHTSKLLEPYADKHNEYGTSMMSAQALKEVVAELDQRGFQVHFHADGDAAVRDSLDAVQYAIEKNGPSANRHHIAHLELVAASDLKRFKELNVTANVQPMWSTSYAYINDLLTKKLGDSRRDGLELNRAFFDNGARVAYGSDWFVTTPNPMHLIEAAVTRIRPSRPLVEKKTATAVLPGDEVSIDQAISAYTIGSAYVNGIDVITGTIEVGKNADLVLLNKNIFSVSKHEISSIEVSRTWVDGRIVYINDN